MEMEGGVVPHFEEELRRLPCRHLVHIAFGGDDFCFQFFRKVVEPHRVQTPSQRPIQIPLPVGGENEDRGRLGVVDLSTHWTESRHFKLIVYENVEKKRIKFWVRLVDLVPQDYGSVWNHAGTE